MYDENDIKSTIKTIKLVLLANCSNKILVEQVEEDLSERLVLNANLRCFIVPISSMLSMMTMYHITSKLLMTKIIINTNSQSPLFRVFHWSRAYNGRLTKFINIDRISCSQGMV